MSWDVLQLRRRRGESGYPRRERPSRVSDAQDLRFIVEDDDGNRNVLPLQVGLVTIGREPGNQVCLSERNVSRKHATLQLSFDGLGQLTDLGSYNGVFVNGSRIDKQASIKLGDTLRIGDYQIELRGNVSQATREESTQRTLLVRHDENEGTQPQTPAALAHAMAAEATNPTNAPVAVPDESTEVTGTAVQPQTPAAPQPMGDEPLDRTALLPHAQAGTATANHSATGPQPPYFHLLCLNGSKAGNAYPLSRSLTIIGRTDDNDIALGHRSISRQHARIEWDNNRFRIVDLESANGTLVNGESYQQSELHPGDITELGHIKLRFVAAGAPLQLSVEERLDAGRDTDSTPSFSGKQIFLTAAIAFAIAAMGTAAVVYLGRSKALGPTGAPSGGAVGSASSTLPVNSASDEATSLLNQASAARDAHNFTRAQALATAVLAIDPSRTQAQDIVHQAGQEEHGRVAFEMAQAAINNKAWADAFNALQDVPKETSFAARAPGLLAQIKPALLHERQNEARTALAQKDYDEAGLLIDEIAALEPQDPSIAELKQLLEQAHKTRAAHPQAAPPLHTPRTPRGAAGKRSEQARATKAVPLRVAPPSDNAEVARTAYGEGTRALSLGQIGRAIDSFNRCVSADKDFAMCYRALGIAHAKNGNGPKAVKFYKQYLKVDPTARDAAAVRQLLQQYSTMQAQEAPEDPAR